MSMSKKSNDSGDKKARPPTQPTIDIDKHGTPCGQFFIAALGGSAGGFEAFEKFFQNLPLDTGVGYVIITHLDPTKKDLMPELIQRSTRMPVVQAEDSMAVKPDHVYIIPPNKDMAISGGQLKLLDMSMPRGVHMPIDAFLRSLAEDREEQAIAIIVSGMGTDGTLGVKAIKGNNGLVMVQDPSTAKFDSMPQSAINTGMVDYVEPLEDLPEKMVEYIRSYRGHIVKSGDDIIKSPSDLEKIMDIIRHHTGHDFSAYKFSTICRRIERRMSVYNLKNLSDYVEYLNKHPNEIESLFKELLIGVTSFFRDPEAFEALKKDAIPEILNSMPNHASIRVWVPGCSTGEEAYSIAMVLMEALGDRPVMIQIFATDIDKAAIDFARKGVYPENIVADVSQERLQRFFTKEEDHYKVMKRFREMIIFAEQDLVIDPPFTGMDMISCRNLLIYLTGETQKRIISTFAYSLNSGGILFLGTAESVGNMTGAFTTINNKWKIFKRKGYGARRYVSTIIPAYMSNPIEREKLHANIIKPGITELAHQVLMDAFSPPSVIVDHFGNIAFVHGHTGKYLEPAPGKANMNIFAMAREGLGTDLGMAFEKAKKGNTDVVVEGIDVQTNGHTQAVNVTVKPIRKPDAMKDLLLVVFEDVEKRPPPRRVKAGTRKELEACRQLEDDLSITKERLRTTTEEMHASQEEMRSMNEELQSTNEELQSTNEELTTSKEELQSLNEELLTVNSELHAKVDDLTSVNNDIRNLLNSTDVATIFLDRDFRIKRFTPSVSRLVNLLPTDTGRPITDISMNIKDPGISSSYIAQESHHVLETLASVENQLETKDGRWFIMRILPYKTIDNVIDGVVLTFSDITEMKHLERSIESSKEYAEAIVSTIREPLVVLDESMHIISANKAFFNTFRVSPAETEHQLLFNLGNGQWNIPALREQLEKVLPKEKTIEGVKVEHEFPDIGHRVMLLNARKFETTEKKGLILLAIEDITT
jgi:two-component system, chemotaxis family, CheB/CheR fusion protein